MMNKLRDWHKDPTAKVVAISTMSVANIPYTEMGISRQVWSQASAGLTSIPEVDALYNQMITTPDDKARAEIIKQMYVAIDKFLPYYRFWTQTRSIQ